MAPLQNAHRSMVSHSEASLRPAAFSVARISAFQAGSISCAGTWAQHPALLSILYIWGPVKLVCSQAGSNSCAGTWRQHAVSETAQCFLFLALWALSTLLSGCLHGACQRSHTIGAQTHSWCTAGAQLGTRHAREHGVEPWACCVFIGTPLIILLDV